jgi:hypothetical protein
MSSHALVGRLWSDDALFQYVLAHLKHISKKARTVGASVLDGGYWVLMMTVAWGPGSLY